MGYQWVHSSAYSSIPKDAVIGGNDSDGEMMYVGRSWHNGDLLVAKILPLKHAAFVSLSGKEIPKTHFEVLCGKHLEWIHCYDHTIPKNAISSGLTSLGQPIYVGRGHHEGSLTVGKVSSVHRALYIPFKGSEKRLETYEILVDTESKHFLEDLPPFEASEQVHTKSEVIVKQENFNLNVQSIMFQPPNYEQIMSPPNPPPLYPNPTAPTESPPAYEEVPSAIGTKYEAAGSFTPASSYQPPSSSFQPANVYQPAEGASFQPASTYQPPVGCFPQVSGYKPAETYQPPSVHQPCVYQPNLSLSDVWMPSSGSCIPPNAVPAGHDIDMATIFVCRAFHNGLLIPGKAIPNRSCAFIPYNGQELVKNNFEVLVGEGKYIWVPASYGHVPPGAVEGGRTETGEPLYVGRCQHAGSLTPGKVHRSQGCLYIPFGCAEHRISHNYEVLVDRQCYYSGRPYHY